MIETIAHYDRLTDGLHLYFAPSRYFGIAKYNHLLNEEFGGGLNIAFDGESKLAVLSTLGAKKRFAQSLLESAEKHGTARLSVRLHPDTDTAEIWLVEPEQARKDVRQRFSIEGKRLSLHFDLDGKILSIEVGEASKQLHPFLLAA
jgi:uncharacterized protein YuzE